MNKKLFKVPVLVRVGAAVSIKWTYAISSLFAPYIFVLFGREKLGSKE